MGDAIQTAESGPKNAVSVIRVLIASMMVLAGVGILALSMTGSNAANKDFVTYWAAGKQLVRHASPYDGVEILRLEREAGCKENRPYFMRNPPTALFLALPFGLMNEWQAAMVWSLMLVASLAASIRMIWMMEGRPPGRLHLIGYIFPPVLECITVGQVGILLLLGFTGFLYFHKSRPAVAGLFLGLCAIKPHLFLPVVAVLMLWCIKRGDYRVLLGLSGALTACLLLTHIVDPSAWPQYFQMMKAENLHDEPIPTISLLFRAAINVHATWLQFVPTMAATACAVWHFHRLIGVGRSKGFCCLRCL
jgi:Glycosyltransferase family 87